jgi:hypothetical protein
MASRFKGQGRRRGHGSVFANLLTRLKTWPGAEKRRESAADSARR